MGSGESNVSFAQLEPSRPAQSAAAMAYSTESSAMIPFEDRAPLTAPARAALA
jgi:hypothetical protein